MLLKIVVLRISTEVYKFNKKKDSLMKSVSEFCEILQKNSIAELLQTTTLLICQDLKTTAVTRTCDPWYRMVRNSAGS